MKITPKKISTLLIIVLIVSCVKKGKQVNNFSQNKAEESSFNVDIEELNSNNLPNDIIYDGNFIRSIKWKYKGIESLLLIYYKGPFAEKNIIETEDERYVEFYIEQYSKENGKYILLWKNIDFVKNCAYDIWAGLANSKAIYITDINKNEITETSFAYYLTCRSDVSPSRMKFIMREGNDKYALRGYSIIDQSNNEFKIADFEPNLSKFDVKDDSLIMGRFESDKDFSDSDEFLKFATQKWMENVIERDFKQFR